MSPQSSIPTRAQQDPEPLVVTMSATRSSDSLCHGSTSQTHCESSCSQRWHRRITAALCMVGVTLSFVIIALGLLFGGWPAPRTALCMGEPERQCRGCQRERPCTEHKTGSHAKRCLHFSSLAHMKILAAEGLHRRR
ncbi:hypothetical protein MRX96_033089 [Rhipicephalus microplus]